MSTLLPPPPSALRLALLQSTRTYPAISVLLSTAGEPFAVETRLVGLIAQAEARLQAELDRAEVDKLATALRQLAEETPLDHRSAAVALFVARGSATAVHLPIPVRDRVVIDKTFATRDLVHARLRSPRYRVLTVGGRLGRLYEGLGPVLDQVHGGGFPVDLEPVEEQPQRPGKVRHEKNGRQEEQLRRLVQVLDAALAPHLRDDPTPLFVVGAERRLAAVRESSRYAELVSATITRPADRLPVGELGALVRPHLDALLEERQAEALTELDEARSAKRYAAGIGEAWPLAVEGRAALLVVEEGFEYPARVDQTTNVAEPAEDAEAPGVVDDLVDETIEAVLRARGRVVIVPDGTLTDAERIALGTRW